MTISDVFRKEDSSLLWELVILSVEWRGVPGLPGGVFPSLLKLYSSQWPVLYELEVSTLIFYGKGGIGVVLSSSGLWKNSLNLSLLVNILMSSFNWNICNLWWSRTKCETSRQQASFILREVYVGRIDYRFIGDCNIDGFLWLFTSSLRPTATSLLCWFAVWESANLVLLPFLLFYRPVSHIPLYSS